MFRLARADAEQKLRREKCSVKLKSENTFRMGEKLRKTFRFAH
jgi:hypothetical protein